MFFCFVFKHEEYAENLMIDDSTKGESTLWEFVLLTLRGRPWKLKRFRYTWGDVNLSKFLCIGGHVPEVSDTLIDDVLVLTANVW